MSLTIDNSSRLSGLASGLETDTIVEGLMASYRTKLDKQSQLTTKMEWTAEAYRGINTLIKNFREKYLSVLSSTNMMSNSAYGSLKATMLTATSAASVTVSSAASEGSYTINSVTKLAAAATQSGLNAFTGTSYTSDTTLAGLSLANAFTFDENDELSFSINDKTFTFTKETTIGDMMKQVNSSGAGVTMKYSSLAKGFSITSNTMGSASSIAIVNITGNAFASEDSALGISQGTYGGQDAELSINNIPVTQSGNTFTYDGVTYTITDESSTPIRFTVSRDYQSTVDSIVAFVDAYNELVGELQSKLGEKVYDDYPPLTDAQKEEMSEEEIKKWEEKAKSGLLHNDSYISTILKSLRSAFYTEIEGTGMNLSNIGLTTGTYSEGAKIKVDKEKLLAAIKKDPENIKNMFIQTSATGRTSEEGLIVRISDALLNYTKQTTSVALENLETRISDSEDREAELQARMEDKEASLWARFSLMESALARLNSMSSWLSTLFTA
jgi:Flagellar capping protein